MNSLIHKASETSDASRGVTHHKREPAVKPKLTVNTPGDSYEQEADAMADRVMRLPAHMTEAKQATGLIGRSVQSNNSSMKRKHEAGGESTTVSPEFVSALDGSRNSGSPLPAETRNFMETAFSTDFSAVKVHTDSGAADMSEDISAKAFTSGRDIYFNSGFFSPESATGKHLLAHELTHILQQKNETISRAPMPVAANVANLETYGEPTRQNIIYDPGFNLQTGLSTYFQPGINMAVRTGYDVSYVVKGFDPAESWVEPAMKAMMLYNFNLNSSAKDAPITNITTVQHLDMTGQSNPKDAAIKGPNAMVRCTSTKFDATVKPQSENVQLLVEKLKNYTSNSSTETPAARKARYEKDYKITNAAPITYDPLGEKPEAMSDDKYDMVLKALDVIPAKDLTQGAGIPIHMGLTPRGPDNEVAEYSQNKAAGSSAWTRKITVYQDFFSATAEQKAFTMAHEFGHALDFRPNEGDKGKGGPSLSQATGPGSFSEALNKDGGIVKGVSTYDQTKKSQKEYFAEAFTMYLNQPDTLKALRPNIYAYFLAKYP
ncbi:MAG: DUF4157 domain-containing protein [Chlorobium sp.]|jgi:Domain of unknown function (DUF4157)|nr:MAG: DUF4157 domain-containing protein [Chlorobium sp.]